MKYCLVIPHYNHTDQFRLFLPKLLALGLPVFLIDDGSISPELTKLRTLIEDQNGVRLIELGINRGKGAAVMVGFTVAGAEGFSHVVQVDADGQHDLTDVPKLMDASRENPEALVSGKPYFDDSAPKIRVYGRRITDLWTAIETGSFQIKDGLCGFRVYPLAAMTRVTDSHYIGPRMDFDTEVLVKSVWEGVPLVFVDTKVTYLDGTVSHFRYFLDNVRFISMHIRLLIGASWRLPRLMLKRFH